jgi:hypothetical protein
MKRAIAALLCVATLAGCTHAQRAPAEQASADQSSASPLPALSYPAGVLPPGDYATQMADGIYASQTPAQCCFLGPKARFTLDNPPGAQLAVFTFYVPAVKPFAKQRERVSVAFNGITAGVPAELTTGIHEVIFTIPAALRQRRHLTASLAMSIAWVPQKIGLNADIRELSIMLLKVCYI